MASPRRYSKPIATFEYGTRIYAPSAKEIRFRIVSTDIEGRRIQERVYSETDARQLARDLETRLARAGAQRGRVGAPATVGHLIDRYLASLGSRSVRYAERQEYLLRMWVRPVLGDHPLDAWTPSDSEAVLERARRNLSPATVQNVGSAMRSLVTFAYKNRWLPRDNDPMWLVRYSASAEIQGQTVGYIPRDSLPTDQQCQLLFESLEEAGHPEWSLAMQLKHRSGTRWGELIALRPMDLQFGARRIVQIRRAVEQSRQGFAIKTTKNRQHRLSTFPSSLAEPLQEWAAAIEDRVGPEGLLFPGPGGGFANRRMFQRVWARAARDAGWPMKRPTASVWHPHDLRHVAACWLLFDVSLDAAIVAAMLGHANAAFTLSRYVGVRGDLGTTITAATDGW